MNRKTTKKLAKLIAKQIVEVGKDTIAMTLIGENGFYETVGRMMAAGYYLQSNTQWMNGGKYELVFKRE